jgi:hypothetical protein
MSRFDRRLVAVIETGCELVEGADKLDALAELFGCRWHGYGSSSKVS